MTAPTAKIRQPMPGRRRKGRKHDGKIADDVVARANPDRRHVAVATAEAIKAARLP